MNRTLKLLISAIIIATASCGAAKEPEHKATPALQMGLDSLGSNFVRLDLRVVNAAKVWLLAAEAQQEVSSAQQVLEQGAEFAPGIQLLEGLEPGREYVIYGCARDESGRLGSLEKIPLKTLSGNLYSWEKARSDIPFFADLALIYGSMRRNNPRYWNKDRLRAFVTWTDPDTKEEKWLFDAFLMLDLKNPEYPPRTYMTGALDWDDRSIGMLAATKNDAIGFLDYWFAPDHGFAALDALIGEAASRIGPPKARHKIIVMMPDVSAHERYNVPASSTTYWGAISGRQLDFTSVEDRRRAYYWYIDETRRRFDEAGFANIELGGFYIMTEELPSRRSGEGGRGGDRVDGVMLDGWEVAAKAWDDVFPAVSDYIHQYHECLCWIPYRCAAGYRYWKEFGIDYAWMQPNYYWDTFNVNPISSFFQQIASHDLAMELEFDDMMMPSPTDRDPSEYTKVKDGVTKTETWEDYARRWRGYVEGMQSAPVYGRRQIALYSDYDSFNHLKNSRHKSDTDAFNELCRLIAEDPLKEKNR